MLNMTVMRNVKPAGSNRWEGKVSIYEYAAAARLAIEAGFDGIDLHAANGYLLEQFLNANVNRRTDGYGGTGEGRNRHVLEVAGAAAQAIGAPPVPAKLKADLRAVFSGPFILAGEFDGASAECALTERHADLIAMGRAFLANPDLVDRMRQCAPLNNPDAGTFYTPGASDYTDYTTYTPGASDYTDYTTLAG